jgi:hypothetical protein
LIFRTTMQPFRPTWLTARAALAACGLAVIVEGPARGADADANSTATTSVPDLAATAESDPYPQVSCTGVNPALVTDVLQLATDARVTMKPLLKLGPVWRFPVHVTLTAPAAAPQSDAAAESVSVIADGKTLRLEVRVPSSDPDAREFIERQFVTALLWEKFFKPGTTFTTATRLDVVPMWLVEGLREKLGDDPTHNREEIVKRAALGQRAPTLAEVTGWKDLSNDRLLNLWQRAFCYYLVECLTHPDPRLEDFQGWLASITGPEPKTAEDLFPTEMGWQRELREASHRDRARFYNWDESSAEITAAETIALPKGKHAADTQLCTIETVATFPRNKEMDQAIRAKILELTALELRTHPSWQPVIELYRFGLTALLRDPDPKRAIQYLHEARVQRAAEMANHDSLVDYVNWFEVTQYMPIQTSHFRDYFQIAQELDKEEPDPAHPNPLRADLLKVESKF